MRSDSVFLESGGLVYHYTFIMLHDDCGSDWINGVAVYTL